MNELRVKLERLERKLLDIQHKDEIKQEYLEALEALQGADIEAKFWEMLAESPVILKRALELIFKRGSVQVKSAGNGTNDSGRVTDEESSAGRSFADFAVLYRLGALSQPLIEAFERSGIPFQTVGQTSF